MTFTTPGGLPGGSDDITIQFIPAQGRAGKWQYANQPGRTLTCTSGSVYSHLMATGLSPIFPPRRWQVDLNSQFGKKWW